jgi:cobalt-zinc-cadmium efflux system protein
MAHDHDHEGHHHHPHGHHGHDHGLSAGSPVRLGLVLGVNVALTAVQIVGGIIAGSLALLADAAHNAVDVVGLAMAAVAVVLARRPAGPRHTYGWRRSEALAAQVSALLLVVSLLWVGYEAVGRLVGDAEATVDGPLVAVLAGLGLLANGGGVLVLRAGRTAGRDTALATRAAVLHLAGDAITSAAVLLAGIAIAVTDASWIDPVVSLAVAVVVAVATVRLLGESTSILLDATPSSVDTTLVATAMEAVDGVAAVHHLHVWSLAEREVAVSAHVVVDGPTTLHDTEETLAALQTLLADRFGIAHPTLQLECHPCDDQTH